MTIDHPFTGRTALPAAEYLGADGRVRFAGCEGESQGSGAIHWSYEWRVWTRQVCKNGVPTEVDDELSLAEEAVPGVLRGVSPPHSPVGTQAEEDGEGGR